VTDVRRARAAVTVVFVAHGVLFGSWVSRIPAIQDDLDLTEGELGIALLGGTAGALIALPVAGWIVARTGSRTTLVRDLPVFVASVVAIGLAENLATLALTLLLFGMALGTLDVAMNAHGLAVEREYGRPILSSFHGGWSSGGLIGAALGALAAWLDVEPLPHFAAVALVAGCVALLATRWLFPADADRPEEGARLARPPRRIALLGLVAFCGLFAEGAAADWSGIYIDDSLEATPGVAALGFAAFSVTMAVFRLLGDRLTVHWGPVALMRRGGLLAAGGLAGALVIAHPIAALVGFACMGAGLAAVVPVVFRAAGSIPGLAPAAGIAALTSVGYSAFLVGPPAIGFLAEVTGLPAALAVVVALLCLLAVFARSTAPVQTA
jgi:predicted MFS family arabinose efflux permease